MKLKTMLHWVWKQVQKAVSFLTTLLIITAVIVATLYLLNIKPYVVTTGSMEPAIPVQSICFVNENIPIEEIAVGQVISFRVSDNMLVTHRVIDINGGEYTTKGDANNTADVTPVTAENYIGQTVVIIPKLGYILIFLHSKKGKIASITLIVLLLILSFIPKKDVPKKSETAGQEGGNDGTDKIE